MPLLPSSIRNTLECDQSNVSSLCIILSSTLLKLLSHSFLLIPCRSASYRSLHNKSPVPCRLSAVMSINCCRVMAIWNFQNGRHLGFDPPACSAVQPKKPYPRSKTEVEQTTCGWDMAVWNFSKWLPTIIFDLIHLDVAPFDQAFPKTHPRTILEVDRMTCCWDILL